MKLENISNNKEGKNPKNNSVVTRITPREHNYCGLLLDFFQLLENEFCPIFFAIFFKIEKKNEGGRVKENDQR